MTAANRHALAEKARLERLASNPQASDFERDSAEEQLARLGAHRSDTDAWTNPDAICRWCARQIKTHALKPDGSPLPRSELGSSLCPVVRDLSVAGRGAWERLYRPPTEDEAAQWRADNNAATTVRKPTKAERDADARERKARQIKIDV